jgi:arylsulfatase A-like enzyme
MRVLVIVAQGLQTNALGCYGNEWLATPNFDRLAAAGIVCDQHYADAADPAGARRAWRSGRYQLPAAPPEEPTPAPSTDDLLALLREHRVATALIRDGERSASAEFAAGWDHFDEVAGSGEGSPLERALEAAVERLDEWAERDDWLLWLDLAALLPPWDVPEEYLAPFFDEEEEEADEGDEEEDEAAEPLTPLLEPTPGVMRPDDDATFLRLWQTYAGAVAYLDAGLGLLLDELRDRDLDGEIAIVLTADCGLPLGEHGEIGDVRPWLHEERIHVPLLVRFPGAAEAGRRVSALTQAVDLAPTLLELFGVVPPAFHGSSLLPLLRGQATTTRPYACAGLRTDAGAELCLRTAGWSLRVPLEPPGQARQLYVKPDDRFEVNDVVQHHQERADRLEQTLRAFAVAVRQAGTLQTPPLAE